MFAAAETSPRRFRRPIQKTKIWIARASAMPIRPGRTSPNACWICGYRVVAKKDRRNFGCCKRFSHNACWKRQFLVRGEIPLTKGAKCCQVSNYLKKDRFTIDCDVKTTKTLVEDPTDGLKCDLCMEDISGRNQDSAILTKNHYMSECKAIPGGPVLETASRKDLINRVAALGLVKRLGKVDRVSFDDVSESSRENLERKGVKLRGDANALRKSLPTWVEVVGHFFYW